MIYYHLKKKDIYFRKSISIWQDLRLLYFQYDRCSVLYISIVHCCRLTFVVPISSPQTIKTLVFVFCDGISMPEKHTNATNIIAYLNLHLSMICSIMINFLMILLYGIIEN